MSASWIHAAATKRFCENASCSFNNMEHTKRAFCSLLLHWPPTYILERANPYPAGHQIMAALLEATSTTVVHTGYLSMYLQPKFLPLNLHGEPNGVKEKCGNSILPKWIAKSGPSKSWLRDNAKIAMAPVWVERNLQRNSVLPAQVSMLTTSHSLLSVLCSEWITLRDSLWVTCFGGLFSIPCFLHFAYGKFANHGC